MDIIIQIGSVSQTNKGRRALQSVSIRSKMVKTDSVASGGCAWGLRFDEKDFQAASVVLMKEGVRYEML
ncbi:MAG: DUF3343 domain-containing protein [Clostridia bacterium]|nr:DUF3343 domain-containing protein [Clostridia bacterium]